MDFLWADQGTRPGSGRRSDCAGQDFRASVRAAGKARKTGLPVAPQLCITLSKDVLKRLRWQNGDRIHVGIAADGSAIGLKRVVQGGFSLSSLSKPTDRTWWMSRIHVGVRPGWPFKVGDVFSGKAVEDPTGVVVLALSK